MRMVRRGPLGRFLRRLSGATPQQTLPRISYPIRQCPMPPGLTELEVRAIFESARIDTDAPGSLVPYVADSLWRFLFTWDLVREDSGKCLELGANPYFTTWLLHRYTSLDLTLANYFGPSRGPDSQRFSWIEDSQDQSVVFSYDHFNSEEDRFPYDDESFDVVLYCEIIEHLLMNPVHTLTEIHRVLKPGGKIVITTPNVARFTNVLAMIEGRSIYDPYSGFGPYGRHNREYSLDELKHLIRFSGFEVVNAFTANGHPEDYAALEQRQGALRLVKHRLDNLGHYLFVVGRKNRTPQPGLPSSLFRSHPSEMMNTDW